MSNFPKELEMLPSLPSRESEKSKIKSNSQSCKLLSSLNLSTVSNHKNMMMRLDRRRQEFGLRAKSLSEGAPFVSYRLPLASYPLIEAPFIVGRTCGSKNSKPKSGGLSGGLSSGLSGDNFVSSMLSKFSKYQGLRGASRASG